MDCESDVKIEDITEEVIAQQEVAGEEVVVSEDVSSFDPSPTFSEDPNLLRIYDLVLPLSRNLNLLCELNSDFLNIFSQPSEGRSKFFPLLNLIIYISEGNLLLKLYLEHSKVFKESCVMNIDEQLSKHATPSGIVTIVSAFLSELSEIKYSPCSGAFEEDDFMGDFNSVNIRSILIEYKNSKIVYRSRRCYLLVKESKNCEACEQLFLSHSECLKKVEDETKTAIEGIETLNYENFNSEAKANEETTSVKSHSSYVFPSQSPNLNVVKLTTSKKSSYKKLIIDAIKSSPRKMLKLQEIYEWIYEHYPAFQADIQKRLSRMEFFSLINPKP